MKTLSKQDFYKLVVVLSIFAIILLIFFVTFSKRNNIDDDPVIEENNFSDVTNYNIFFFVNNNINTFIKYTADSNVEGLINYLDEDYKKENNINITNLKNFTKFYSQEDYYMAKITKSYQVNDDVTVYYTEGQILSEGYEETIIVDNNVKYILYVDYGNMAASLKIVNTTINENDVKNINTEKRISSNNSNAIKQIELMDTNRICIMYLADFINKVYSNTGYQYVNNFDSFDSYQDFIKNNNLISNVKSCNNSINNENKRVYTILDTNNYRYVFTEESILNYKVSISK